MLAQPGPAARRPRVNFITAHDGFTLHDLVSYNDKHNEANGEDNRDGINENDSWNCGVEGDTDDPEVLQLRARQKRNLLATLLLSQGVPHAAGRRRDGQHASTATTTPTARTARSPGSSGTRPIPYLLGVRPAADRGCAASIRSSAGRTSSAASRSAAPRSRTSSGSTRKGASSATRTGTSRRRAAWASCSAATRASCSTPPAAGRSSTTASSC